MKEHKVGTQSFLIDQLQNKNNSFFDYLTFIDPVHIHGSPACDKLFFDNCIFEKGLSLQSGSYPEGIHFSNCQFIYTTSLSDLTLDYGEKLSRSHFRECTFGTLRLSKIDGNRIFSLIKCQIEILDIVDCKFPEGVICTESKSQIVRVEKNKISLFTLDNFDLTEDLFFNNNECSTVAITKTKSTGTAYISNVETNRISIKESAFKGVELINVSGVKSIYRNEFTDECSISFSGPLDVRYNVGSLEFVGNTFKKVLRVNGGSANFEEISIECNDSISGPIHFQNCKAKSVKISGTNSDGEFLFIRTEISKLEFYDFTNLKTLSFFACSTTSDGEFNIFRSDLGKTKFLTHNFNDYQRIKIVDSFLSDILFVSCIWFTDEKLETRISIFQSQHKKDYKARREIYRQLKQAAERQGDRIQALVFQARELEAFENEISQTSHWWSADRWILRLTKSNRFGLDWSLAFIWMMVWTFIFFIPMGVLASPKLSWLPAKNIDDIFNTVSILFWDRLPIFIQLFNPAHNPVAYVDKDQISPLYFLLDGIHRIGAAFLIVQIISAFRKYIKG